MSAVQRVLEKFAEQHTCGNDDRPRNDTVGLPFRYLATLGYAFFEKFEGEGRKED